MIEEFTVAKTEAGFDRAEAFIRSTVNEPPNTRIYEGSGAHCARFDSAVNRGSGETVITDLGGSGAERQYLGVGRRVAVGDRAIKRGRHELALTVDQTGADGHFVEGPRFVGRGDRDMHPFFVVR